MREESCGIVLVFDNISSETLVNIFDVDGYIEPIVM